MKPLNKNNKINKNEPWPYYIAGILLGLLNICLLFLTSVPWKISTGLLYIAMGFIEKIGFDPKDWYYFNIYSNGLGPGESFLKNRYVVMVFGIMVGSLLSVLYSSQFKFKRLKNKSQFFWAITGGLLMGYGTRLAFGCNIGAYFSAIPSLSFHGWIFAIFMFLGAWIGSKILFKYIL